VRLIDTLHAVCELRDDVRLRQLLGEVRPLEMTWHLRVWSLNNEE
jgi:hypothetical protein